MQNLTCSVHSQHIVLRSWRSFGECSVEASGCSIEPQPRFCSTNYFQLALGLLNVCQMYQATLEYLHCVPFALSSVMPQICLRPACEFSTRQANTLLNVEAIKKPHKLKTIKRLQKSAYLAVKPCRGQHYSMNIFELDNKIIPNRSCSKYHSGCSVRES